MNASQIICKLRDYSQFIGVFASDELPLTVARKPSLYIVNTDVATGPGLHWVAFFFPIDGVPEFFDSTAHPPGHYHASFQRFLGSTYKFPKIRLQDFQAKTCGHYCIFYGIHRCRGWSLENIMHIFDEQTTWQNDQMMREMFPT